MLRHWQKVWMKLTERYFTSISRAWTGMTSSTITCSEPGNMSSNRIQALSQPARENYSSSTCVIELSNCFSSTFFIEYSWVCFCNLLLSCPRKSPGSHVGLESIYFLLSKFCYSFRQYCMNNKLNRGTKKRILVFSSSFSLSTNIYLSSLHHRHS